MAKWFWSTRAAVSLCSLTALLVLIPGLLHGQAAPVTTVRVASGLVRPIYVTHAPGDSSRIFIIEKQGRIRILKNGTLLATPFLDIDSLAAGGTTDFSEQGLLGLAFDPAYQTNGFFYVNYTNNAGDTVVARYQVSANPDVANPGSSLQILLVDQPYDNHNGGWMAFGPDGYLYIAFGDGGNANDPGNRAQTITNMLLGKMLRIDPSRTASPGYTVPSSNPFVGVTGDDEIWAYGLRNPWRPSFDRLTGDLWIADVGQAQWEEINFQPATNGSGAYGGRNYGWRCMEGLHCTGLTGCTCNSAGLTLPIHEYSHSFGCSITGGYVYRGSAIPELNGAYFFADYCGATIWTLRYDGVSVSDLTDRTAALAPGGGLSISWITSFGEDEAGELYICDQPGGEVFKIIRNAPEAAKLVPDNTPYNLRGAVVTAVYPDSSPASFYIEDDDRTSGIRVEKAAHGLTTGLRADVMGLVKTNASGERYIEATLTAAAGTGSVDPLGMTNKWIGGGDQEFNPVTGAGQQGVNGGFGVNNIGLLVRTWGRVTSTGTDYIIIDDGSGVFVKCKLPTGMPVDPNWDIVGVTGVSSCEKVGSELHRLIRVRSTTDITPY